MNEDATRFVLQVLAVLLGGGSVQLLLRFAFKKSDLRKVNTESDSVVVTAANNQVIRLEAELIRLSQDLLSCRKELGDQRTEHLAAMTEMQRVHSREMAEAQERSNELIEEFRRENVKQNKLVSRLQLDLSRANAEIAILKSK
jgi:hypothetical protein